MKDITVAITPSNTISYPMHTHTEWEVMYYLQGEGYLQTEVKNIDFKKGTIIIVPPNLRHGSVSQNGFVNISVSADFGNLFMFEEPIKIYDDESFNGEVLARLIFNNRFLDNDYLWTLSLAYAHFILQNADYTSRIHKSVAVIIAKANENFFKPDFDMGSELEKSGYATDYIRAVFKEITKLTPNRFLTELRINYAKKLFEIYGSDITVVELAFRCGYKDEAYFSKRFKAVVGCSPNEYRKKLLK